MSKEKSTKFASIFPFIVIPIILVISMLFYMFVLGAPENFEGGDPERGHPVREGIEGWYGTVYKGGPVVAILVSIVLVVIAFSVERGITIGKARGRGRIETFLKTIRGLISNGQLDAAIEECDRQKGSVASVLRNGLVKYKAVEADHELDKEAKLAAIQKEIEEATALELPMLSKNMVVISTCASISTLIGLIGTVIGMIRAFKALAQAGAPDTIALSTGISEALINTFIGITGSCIAIIMYNYFSNKIDALTHGIDEAGFTLSQTFASTKH
jgi:biopolymer transport protein ExbB